MSQSQNWRTEVNAGDYFSHQKKQLNLADRRPVIRKASDLVGPGINASATRVSDFNDVLAAFNGYFSATPGALNAPNATGSFVGYTVMDSLMGGEQVLTELETGDIYRRVFLRAPADPNTISWGSWRIVPRELPTFIGGGSGNTVPVSAASGAETPLIAPTVYSKVNSESTFAFDNNEAPFAVLILRTGVYTGSINVDTDSSINKTISITTPGEGGSDMLVINVGSQTNVIPFTFIHRAQAPGTVSVTVQQTSGVAHSVAWSRFALTRISDD